MTSRRTHAALCALISASPCLAGGFSTPIIGSRMIGRIAFVAKANDTSSIFHNPAGLAELDGYKVEISAVGIFSHTVYRTYMEDGTESSAIRFERPYGVLPYVGFSGDFGCKRFRFGLGLYSPHNTAATLPEDSPAKFQLIEGRIVTLFLTPTVACRINDQWSLGAGVSLVSATAGLRRWTDLEPATGLPIDALIDLNADDYGYGWDAGALWHPTHRLSFGATYQSPVKLGFHGDLTAVNPSIDLHARGDVAVDFTLPQSLRVGVDYQITDRIDAGFDAYWQDYSVYKDLTVQLSHATARIGTSDFTLNPTRITEVKNAHDIYGIGLGGTYAITDRWEVSAGYLFDPSPYPNNTYTILSPDANKHGLSVGGGYGGEHWGLHGSYLRLIYEDRVVKNSILTPPANGNTRGKYNNAFSVQLTYAF